MAFVAGWWRRSWFGVLAVTVALVGAGWYVSAAEGERREYDTQEECQRVEQYACVVLGNRKWVRAFYWTDENSQGTVGPPIVRDLDEFAREAKEQREAMPVNFSGTPKHPLVVVDMDMVNFCGNKAEPVVSPYTNVVEFPCDEALPLLDPQTNRTMIPIRFVSEAMGMDVKWSGTRQTVTIRRDGLTVELQVGNTTASVNGKAVPVDAPPLVVPPGRVLVPLRFVSDAFGAKVDWVGEESPDGDPAWGKYQVWIWVPWGYWGTYNIQERLFEHNQWLKKPPRNGGSR